MRLVVLILLGLTCHLPPLGAAPETAPQTQPSEFQYKTALAASQAAIDRTPADYPFTNADGETLSLHDLRGKPLVLSLVYTSCYYICPMTTQHLAKVVEKARKALGGDSFNVALLGFDVQYDTPRAMLHFADKQGVGDAAWYLLSTDRQTIDALTAELGFIFFPSPNGFDHIVQATILDADGRVYRQVYGEVFDTPLLVEPLKDLVLGRPKPNQTFLADLIDRVRFFCTTYDPNRDAYHFDYSLFIGLFIGATIILSGAAFIVREMRKKRRPHRA